VPLEFDAGLHEFIHARSFGKPAMPADIRPSKVVGDDHQHVWFLSGF
jgi:hypothetical protein